MLNNKYYNKIIPMDNFKRQKYNQYISLLKETTKPPIVIEGNAQQKMFQQNILLQYAYKYSQTPNIPLSSDN